MSKYIVNGEMATDFVLGDDNKTAASWNDRGAFIVCEFIRSHKDGKKWVEDSRVEVISIDATNLPEDAKDFCVRYGLKQIVADRCFAMAKDEMTKDTERERLARANEFLHELFETGKVPVKRRKGLSEEQKKERKMLVDKLAVAMKEKNWKLAGEIGDEMEAKGYEL